MANYDRVKATRVVTRSVDFQSVKSLVSLLRKLDRHCTSAVIVFWPQYVPMLQGQAESLAAYNALSPLERLGPQRQAVHDLKIQPSTGVA